jgi:hypothetical protein
VALVEPHDTKTEALVLDTSAGLLARKVFINAIGGFENLTSQCQNDHNSGSGFCAAQTSLINYFVDSSDGFANAAEACSAGYLSPLAQPECIGGLNPASGVIPAGPGCGSNTAANVNDLSQCTPL